MEKRKIKLLRSMQSLLTDFTVKSDDGDAGGTNGNNTNNIHTKLSKLQQILKMKTSDDLRNSLAEELLSIQKISEIKSDKKQDGEELYDQLSTKEVDYLNSTAETPDKKQDNRAEQEPGETEENVNSTTESSNEDCQWRFVETCMNSLLLLAVSYTHLTLPTILLV